MAKGTWVMSEIEQPERLPEGAEAGAGEIPQRALGRTGVKVSALGVGGHHLGEFKTAEEAGKVRFVGFTGHKEPAVHLDLIRRGYPFDAVQMPLNCLDANFRSFEKQVLPEANRRGIGVLGMKPMGGTAGAIKAGLVKA